MATMTIDQYTVRLIFPAGYSETLLDDETGNPLYFATEAEAQDAGNEYVTQESLSIVPEYVVEWDELATWKARCTAARDRVGELTGEAFNTRQALLGKMGDYLRAQVASMRELAAELDLDLGLGASASDLGELRQAIDSIRSSMEDAAGEAERAEEKAGEAYDAADSARDYAGEAQGHAEETRSRLSYLDSALDEADNLLANYGA